MPRERRRRQGEEGESGGKKEAPVAKGGFRYGGYRCCAEGTGMQEPAGRGRERQLGWGGGNGASGRRATWDRDRC
mgnify:CR=1 FL=1